MSTTIRRRGLGAAPFYERHGFVRLDPSALPAWLAEIRRAEAREGLDRWPRVAMARELRRRP
ncbi:MAG: hypothetical protein GXY23_16320 [Myxococcales bacterium]|jgi:hypothetical protein|nr:hypothetical protein [Myxococcales bacterium]